MHISPNLQVFRVSAAWRRQQTPYRGLDAAVWAVPASVNGSQLTCGPIYAATRLERPSFKGPPEAGAALPRQDPRGCRRSNRRPVRLPVSRSGSRGSNRRSRPVAANGSYRRGSGSCNSGGRMPRERRVAASASVGQLLRRSRAANRPHCTTLSGAAPRLCGCFLLQYSYNKADTGWAKGARSRDPPSSRAALAAIVFFCRNLEQSISRDGECVFEEPKSG